VTTGQPDFAPTEKRGRLRVAKKMSANASNKSGSITLRTDVKFNGVKVFSATMVADREQLGEKVTDWIAKNPHKKVTDIVITQSSDEAFHCIAITVFFFEDLAR